MGLSISDNHSKCRHCTVFTASGIVNTLHQIMFSKKIKLHTHPYSYFEYRIKNMEIEKDELFTKVLSLVIKKVLTILSFQKLCFVV